MSKPPDWDLLDALVRKYYPKEYRRIYAEQQTRLDLPEQTPPKKGGKRRAAGSRRPDQERKDNDQRR